MFRVRLSKRRKAGAGPTTGAPTSNSRLIVKHRPLNDAEVAAQVYIYKFYKDLLGNEDYELYSAKLS